MTDPLDAKWRAFTRENIARNPDAPMAYGALLPVLDAWEAEVAALRDDSAATIDRWVDALTEIAALRAALDAQDEMIVRCSDEINEQAATIAALRAQLDDARRGRDAALIREKKPPVPWTTIRKDASDRGLYAVVDEAMIGRKLMPSRRRLIVGNIVMAVAEWRESFRDCGCWKTAEGFALCRWHEQAFQPQREEALGAALAALAALRAEVAGMEGPWNGMHEEMRVAVLAAIDRRLEP